MLNISNISDVIGSLSEDSIPVGLVVKDSTAVGIENLSTNDYSQIQKESWYGIIVEQVSEWLSDSGYSSIGEMISSPESVNPHAIPGLINAFNVKYSDIFID